MKFKILTILGLTSSLLFSACGSDSKDPEQIKKEAEAAGKIIYENEEFSIQSPKDWEVIEKNSYPSNVPAEIIVAFRSNIKNEVFTANLNIAKKELQEKEMTVRDFAKGSLAVTKNSLLNFNLIAEDESEIGDIKTYILEFEGKKTSSEAIVHFKQLYIANNDLIYTLTTSYLPTEDESVVNALQEMLDSFSLK